MKFVNYDYTNSYYLHIVLIFIKHTINIHFVFVVSQSSRTRTRSIEIYTMFAIVAYHYCTGSDYIPNQTYYVTLNNHWY